MFSKKHKNLKVICHSKPKIFSVGQPWWPTFFKQSFHDSLYPLCDWGQDIETTTHFLLLCLLLIDQRYTPRST